MTQVDSHVAEQLSRRAAPQPHSSKRCEHGPFKIRPLPGYVCGACGLPLVGPPKPNRDTSLHQTPRAGERRRRMAGVVGTRSASKVTQFGRRLRAQTKPEPQMSKRQLEHIDRVLLGETRLHALGERADIFRKSAYDKDRK